MSFSLLPKEIRPALTAVSLEALGRQGIRLLMLDFDNTIVPYTTSVPTPEMERWLQHAKESQLQICVVSNSKRSRVREFCAAREIPCVTHARKPFSDGICRCLSQFKLQASQCALVGDQIYTDVLGANSAGVYSILIPAINNHSIWLKLRHLLELPIIFCAKGRKKYEKSGQV